MKGIPTIAIGLALSSSLIAQSLPRAAWISPNTRVNHTQQVQVTGVAARISLADQIATTTLDIDLRNPTNRPLESELIVPVPEQAVLKAFAFQGGHPEGTARLLPREEARRIYDGIVAQTRDPALLEFVGHAVVKSSVFPVPANGTQRVRLTYEQVVAVDGDRLDYLLPRSEAVEYGVPWDISMQIRSSGRIASIYSPSHEVVIDSTGGSGSKVTCRTSDPGAFRVTLLRAKDDGLTASLLAYPDPKAGGGYFLLMMAPPPPKAQNRVLQREVTLVMDRSGSMAGAKLDQVKAAALQVIEGLEDGESFNLITYNERVENFAPQPVVKTPETARQARSFIQSLRVSGGTNIHDALVEALRQKPAPGRLPIVLFLTDGLPTVGETSEKAIREAAAAGNLHQRRIFTFGVGVDVNTPLLAHIARATRASAEFVLPREDVEVKVGRVFARLRGPVLMSPALRIAGDPHRVGDLLPAPLPDVFAGEQILVSGIYRGNEPLSFQLSGTDSEGERRFDCNFSLSNASTANAFVARLWARNKIGALSEAIRSLGADGGTGGSGELVNEIVRLSTEFGILTEYTAFLAEEGTQLNAIASNTARAADNYNGRAMKLRSGNAAVAQDQNLIAAGSKQLNLRNGYVDDNQNTVEIAEVQQCRAGAFYKKGSRWSDAAAAQAERNPDRIIEIGTPGFTQLVDELAAENRQGLFALRGELLLEHRGQLVLIR